MAVPHTWLPLNLRFLNPAVPALLLMGQEWCLAHPLYTLFSPVLTTPLKRTAPMALPQMICLPTHFRFLVTGVPAILLPGCCWGCLVHPRYMPSPVSVLPLVVTVQLLLLAAMALPQILPVNWLALTFRFLDPGVPKGRRDGPSNS